MVNQVPSPKLGSTYYCNSSGAKKRVVAIYVCDNSGTKRMISEVLNDQFAVLDYWTKGNGKKVAEIIPDGYTTENQNPQSISTSVKLLKGWYSFEIAGGGGGGWCQSGSSGKNWSIDVSGGGAGSLFGGKLNVITASTVPLTCGVGGAGSASASGYATPTKISNNDENGVSSTIGSIITANGGGKGYYSDNTGHAGTGGTVSHTNSTAIKIEGLKKLVSNYKGGDGSYQSYWGSHSNIPVEGGKTALYKNSNGEITEGCGGTFMAWHGNYFHHSDTCIATSGNPGLIRIRWISRNGINYS